MKKSFIYALLSAIALTGTVCISSCTSSDDVTENPNFNPETNEVTTQFVLNISTDEMATTRQSATTVQKNNNFRGMMDAKLIGLSTGKTYSSTSPTNWLAPFVGNSTGYSVKKTYDLGTLYASGSVTNTNADNSSTSSNANNSSHRVVELTLPLKTDAMLVYGRAVRDNSNDEEYGKVVYSVNETPENTTFELVPRMSSTDEYEKTLLLAQTVLNRIMLSEVSALALDEESPYEVNDNGYKQKADLDAISWRGLGTSTTALSPLEENLATIYRTIATTYSGEDIHAGSAASICNFMKDTYSLVNNVWNATATGDAELNAQRLAYEIKARIEKYFDTSTVFKFRTVGPSTSSSTILYALSQPEVGVDVSSFSAVKNDNFKNFPVTFNLPEGVSQLKFSAFSTDTPITGGFEYLALAQTSSLIQLAQKLNPTKYTYPAELLYFDNSLLRVCDTDKDPDDYPNGYINWDNDEHAEWAGWTIGSVASTTRSVAVKNNINYGVAMLQTSVALGEAPNGYMDNRPELQAYKDIINDSEQTLTSEQETALSSLTITADQIKEFKLTGVLIGGQYKQVGWNYLSTGDGDGNANKDFVIYDNKMNGAEEADPGIAIPTASPNYTLVFDNYAGEVQNDVRIALEFQNSDDVDIYGKGGMIPKGGKFYLVGLLDISGKTLSTWPTKYAIPPYTNNGAPTDIPRIFIQDFVTTATFKIGPNSLENAYTTVPDLRSSQISLGLSVDLNWRNGIEFDNVVLGE